MRKILTLVLLLLLSRALYAQKRDTAVFSPFQLIAPAVLASAGLGIHYFSHDCIDLKVMQWSQELRGGAYVVPFDDYIQYLPYAMDLGLSAAGAKAKHSFADRVKELVIGGLCAAALSKGGKHAFGTLRPNGKNYLSFPSGHSTLAFLGAELVRIEYGGGWGAGAYAIAGTVGAMRIWRNWHWLSDVFLGAGIGIFSAHVGEWLLAPAKSLLGLDDGVKVSVSPTVDPVSGTVCTSVALNF